MWLYLTNRIQKLLFNLIKSMCAVLLQHREDCDAGFYDICGKRGFDSSIIRVGIFDLCQSSVITILVFDRPKVYYAS